ncbi:putative lens epithelial cell protein LEP503, partial [Triplophysa rosa]
LVQDLFDAPATEQEVQALFERLDNPIGYISSQQILAMAHPQGRISQVLAQRGWHGMGLRALRV